MNFCMTILAILKFSYKKSCVKSDAFLRRMTLISMENVLIINKSLRNKIWNKNLSEMQSDYMQRLVSISRCYFRTSKL